MNSTSLLLIPLASLGLLAGSPTPPADADSELRTVLESIDAANEFPVAAAPGKVAGHGLATGALQAASGLHSGARGLTPDEDWQLLFPRSAQRP